MNHNIVNNLPEPEAAVFSGTIAPIADPSVRQRIWEKLNKQDVEVGSIGSVWYLQGSESVRAAESIARVMVGVGQRDLARFNGLGLVVMNSGHDDQEAATLVSCSPDIHKSDAELRPVTEAWAVEVNNTLAVLGSNLRLPMPTPDAS